MYRVACKLELIKNRVKGWNKTSFGNIFFKKELTETLDKL
jgi:hypothetical protein